MPSRTQGRSRALPRLASAVFASTTAKVRPGTGRVEHHVVLATLQAVPFARVRSAFPDAHADASAKTVSLPERTTAKLQMARDGGSGKVQETSFIHIIDSIKSPEDLVARVAELLPPSVFRARKTS